MQSVKRIISVSLLLCLWTSLLLAGNTGKIAGRVTDKQTGEPLIGVNVIVKGTQLGAATDEDGFYYILQVPPGTYDLEFNYIGYHTLTVRKVRVVVDLTQIIDVQMESEAVQGPQIEVIAEQPIIQKDVTSTRRVTSREEIQDTPGFESTSDIFMLSGGTVVDAAPQAIMLEGGAQLQVRDESLKDVHIRGGRGGEVLYMVDGVPVTHPIYGGRDVLDLNVVDVQEMELLTGAFNAEYGQAQSGVINITTRSGTDYYEGGVLYKTSEFNFLSEDYDERYMSFYLGGPEPITRKFLSNIGVHFPGKMNFFISGNVTMDDTPYNNHRDRDHLRIFGVKVREKQDNTANLNVKLNWFISPQVNTMLSYHGTWKSWSNFNWLWKNYPNHMAEYDRANQNFHFRINHTLSKASFYNLNFSYLTVNYNGSLNGQNPASFWRFFKDSTVYNYWDYTSRFEGAPDSVRSVIKPPQRDPYGFIDKESYESIWRDDFTKTFTFKGDFTSQIHPEHLIKTGITIQYNDLRYVDIQDGGYLLSKYGEYRFKNEPEFPAPNGPYKEFGQNRWVFRAFPTMGGAYIQDKFEKETLIINAGVRVDWFTVGSTVMDPAWKKQWEDATGLKADWSWLKYKVSPRFGISFPISEKMVVFFSYGHFNQLPEMQFFYRDPYTGGFTGNPHLDYEQTILYEFGLTYRLARDWALDVKSYTKDISRQVGTTRLRASLGLPVDLYDNKGYARARGLEFELNKRISGYTSGKLTYTVQWANGYSSSAFEDYIRSINDFPNPIRERRLSWDVRHQVIFQGTFNVGKNRGPRFLGIQLPDRWNLTVLARFSSGQPYTPFTLDPVEAQKKENTATGPSTFVVDLKFRKGFESLGVRWSIFADVFNVFDYRNVQIAYGFNTYTGKPFRYGDLDPQLISNHIYRYIGWYDMLTRLDPRQFAAGRHIKLGLQIDF